MLRLDVAVQRLGLAAPTSAFDYDHAANFADVGALVERNSGRERTPLSVTPADLFSRLVAALCAAGGPGALEAVLYYATYARRDALKPGTGDAASRGG